MKVRSILDSKGREVATISPDATVSLAVHKLKLANVGALVVTADDGAISGIVSERDLARGLSDHGGRLLDMRVRDVMSHTVRTCTAEDSIKAVMEEMTYGRVRHLPVVEGGRLCGIVSIGDVVKKRLEELELESHVLRDAYIANR